jgi:hypothetical protein
MTFEIRIVYNEKLLQADWMIGALRSLELSLSLSLSLSLMHCLDLSAGDILKYLASG